MRWAPWEDYKNVEEETLPIEEPPCKHCLFWRPTNTYFANGGVSGVRCCRAEEMFSDFSCYRWSPGREKDGK